MLLPNKSDIDRSKILERRIDIDQAKKISSKLDELRRISAEEEASLKKQREASLKVIQGEIDNAIARRDAANRAAEAAEAAAKGPQEELRAREIAVEKKEHAVEQVSIDLESKSKFIDVCHEEALKIEKSTEQSKQRIQDMTTAIEKTEADTAERNRVAKIVISQREAEADRQKGEVDRLLEEAKYKNKLADDRQRVLDIQAGIQKREQQRLSALERDIIDREGLLKRELARNIKKVVQ